MTHPTHNPAPSPSRNRTTDHGPIPPHAPNQSRNNPARGPIPSQAPSQSRNNPARGPVPPHTPSRSRSDTADRPLPVRCDHDGLKMAEILGNHLVLRARHHGETHVKIIPLTQLLTHDENPGCSQFSKKVL